MSLDQIQARPNTGRGRDGRILLGFFLIGDGKWQGGLNYQRTLLEIIAGPLSHLIEARVFVTEAQREMAQDRLGDVLETPPGVDDTVGAAGRGLGALRAFVAGSDGRARKLVLQNGVDVMFETARFFGRDFPVPVLSWMPDFQHRHLPHLFSRKDWWRREVGFRAQTLGKRTVLLSSEAARTDCEAFYPRTKGRTQVARFAPQVDLDAVHGRAQAARETHGLPERFFFMPNQFWAHKNHAIVLAALRHLQKDGAIDALPPIIMSGAVDDYRGEGGFDALMAQAEAEGLSPWFRHLRLIPFPDVLALNAAAEVVLNPSLFEGWASSVEEAKALGTPLILSDIPVHREQSPTAQFFAPDDARALADVLRAELGKPARNGVDLAALGLANAARKSEFAQALGNAVTTAHQLR